MPWRITGLASTELAITNKRIIGRIGMFRHRKLSLPHKAIEIVKTQRGLLGRMFNYGSLIVTGRDGTRIRFHGIANPMDMELQCNEAAEISILGRSLSKTILSMQDVPRPSPVVTKDGPRLETPLPVIEKAPEKMPVSQSAAAVKRSHVLQEEAEAPAPIRQHKDPNVW